MSHEKVLLITALLIIVGICAIWLVIDFFRNLYRCKKCGVRYKDPFQLHPFTGHCLKCHDKLNDGFEHIKNFGDIE